MIEEVPYLDLTPQNSVLKKKILSAISEIIDNNEYILGSEVEAFEEAFAKYCGTKYAIALNSGTSALHLALHILDLKPGDEVITTPFTFAASAWAISYVGAKPVFVDIEGCHFNICPEKIAQAITKKTRAIIPVHLYGHPCDMGPIVDLCDAHKLSLIEDACQAHGAKYKGQLIGTFGNVAAFSFFPTKNLGACGEGGALVTNDPSLAERIKLLRNHGSPKRYYFNEIGYNYRMENIQGAVLKLKLKYVDKWNEERRRAAIYYNQLLEETELQNYLKYPSEAEWAENVYHLYTITTPYRDALCAYLKERHIGFSNHYAVPMHLQECYKHLGYKQGDLPIAEKAAKEVVNLPLFPGITKKQIKQVVYAIQYFFEKSEKRLIKIA